MALTNSGNPSPEIRNTFYLTVIVVVAVLAGGAWISSAMNLRRSSISYMMPLTSKAMSRSVAKVVESRLSEARLRMLMAPADAAPSTKGGASKAETKKGAAPSSAEEEALSRIQNDPKARRKQPAEPQGDEAAATETTPETYLIGRVTDERGQLVRQLAALIPVVSLRKLEIPCSEKKQQKCLRGIAADDENTLRSAIVTATQEAEISAVVREWTRQVSSDVVLAMASRSGDLPEKANGILLQALAGVAPAKPNAPPEVGADLLKAIARQIASDVAFVTLPASEADWAARDISARLAWGTATVIFVGLWAAVSSLAVHSIWTFTKSARAVVGAVAAATGAAFLVGFAQYALPSSFELFGQLLRMLEVDRETQVAAASRAVTCLVAGSLVLLLAASRAILHRTPGQASEAGGDEKGTVKADSAARLTAFRSLFNTGALLLAAAALEVATLYSWPGSMFDGASEAPASLKAAAVLGGGFAGALLSIVLFLVYVPTQAVLQDWVRRELPDTGTALLNDAGLNDTTAQQFLRLLQAAAPMLAGLPVTGLMALLD